MRPILFCLTFLFILSARADFVDIATIRVNGNKIRKFTNNTKTPYLLNLSEYKVGDTLSVSLWTDYGGQRNSSVTIENLKTSKVDTLDWEKSCLITEEMLKSEFLISAIFHTGKFDIHWDICKLIPDQKIEWIYQTINQLADSLKGPNINLSHLAPDSMLIHVQNIREDSGVFLPGQTTYKSITNNLTKFIKIGAAEREFLDRFNATNYKELVDFHPQYKVHGYINIREEDLDTFEFIIADFKTKTSFEFYFNEGKYILKEINITPFR